ncbi:MAG: hypothetical protein RIC18_15585 [Hoeflea sp.]|uniref:alpha/beta hydrolase family protein n=1 Tax=Hoeflea sp. TaxID=1940281 RepID=UPI0032EF2DC7
MKRLVIVPALTLALAVPASAEMLLGYDSFDLVAAHRSRPVAASIWYPAMNPTYLAPVGDGPIFEPTKAHIGPAVESGRHPLVLLSHGSGGNAQTLGWLASGLVERNAIVLAVNHPGSTSGDSSPRRSVDLEARAADLSAALDSILADPAFSARVDSQEISVVGFSLGGATALGLAGLRFDGEVQDARCEDSREAGDCVFFHKGGVSFADYPAFEADSSDDRIVQSVAIDPGFGAAVTEASLSDVNSRITLINLGYENRLEAADVSPKGNDLVTRLGVAEYLEIGPANHFTFLGVCKPRAAELLAEEGEDPICTDPDGADRKEIHDRLVAAIADALGL